jgi:hypothetical protein
MELRFGSFEPHQSAPATKPLKAAAVHEQAAKRIANVHFTDASQEAVITPFST